MFFNLNKNVLILPCNLKQQQMPNRPITQHPVHITYRVYSSIPAQELRSITETSKDRLSKLKAAYTALSVKEQTECKLSYLTGIEAIEESAYLAYDKLLDQPKKGPTFLSEAGAKQIVIKSWHHIAKQYDLTVYAICVMSNHVHVLLRANQAEISINFGLLMERHKHFTAVQINRLQQAKGRRVWAEKAYDRDVRPNCFTKVFWYILNNPKKAGITDDVLNFPGTWWDSRLEENYIQPFRVAG